MSTKRRTKLGMINMQRSDMGVKKKWKPYRYSVNATYLLYFNTEDMHKPRGQILLTSITKLENDHVKDATFPLQVHFKGKAEQGPRSPWVLDLSSNDERIEWMEAILPGSSAHLKKFSKQGSLHRTPPTSPQNMENPYSVAGPDPDPTYSWASQPNTEQLPLNYIDPVSMSASTVGVQSEYERGNSHVPVPQNLSRSADSKPLSTNAERVNPRQAHNRSTFAHGQRDHAPVQLSRSLTERAISPDHQRTISPDHNYELDGLDFIQQQSRPPLPDGPPPTAKPRNKRPPPRLRNGSGGSGSSSPADVRSPNATQRGSSEQVGKEAEYNPRHNVTQHRQDADSTYSPRSTVKQKPPITPRRGAHPPSQQPEYLHLVGNNDTDAATGGNVYDVPSSARQNGSDPAAVGEMFKNFSPGQLNTLMNMLQQVQIQSDVSEQHKSSQIPVSATTVDGQMKKQFERAISYTPQLQTDKILVVDGDDSEGYEARPDWAKAISAGRSDNCAVDNDTLSDLQEEALYISRSKLTDFSVIGEGQFGKVFRASMQSGSGPISVAVKTAKKSTTSKDKEAFLREMTVMSQMVHPNIVQFYGVIRDDVPAPWIVLEYLLNGDLKSFLMKNSRPIERLVKYMIDVSMGMHYLSEKGLVHRDLAARNVLVGENETCKVSDFGLLRELPKDDSIYSMQTNVPCPVRWMPPESIENRVFSPASDVWSFGILQWEMFYPDKTPYEKLGNIDVAMKVIRGHRLEVPSHCPPVIGRIMRACWHQKPDKRPSFLLISTLLTTKVTLHSE